LLRREWALGYGVAPRRHHHGERGCWRDVYYSFSAMAARRPVRHVVLLMVMMVFVLVIIVNAMAVLKRIP